VCAITVQSSISHSRGALALPPLPPPDPPSRVCSSIESIGMPAMYSQACTTCLPGFYFVGHVRRAAANLSAVEEVQ
jgi:hypothetical protein